MTVKDLLCKLKEDGTEVVIFKTSYRHEDDTTFAWFMRIFYDNENGSLELSAVPNEVMKMDVLSFTVDTEDDDNCLRIVI